MIYKSVLILFVLLVGRVIAGDTVNDIPLGSDTKKKRRPHVHDSVCGHLHLPEYCTVLPKAPPKWLVHLSKKKGKIKKKCPSNCKCLFPGDQVKDPEAQSQLNNNPSILLPSGKDSSLSPSLLSSEKDFLPSPILLPSGQDSLSSPENSTERADSVFTPKELDINTDTEANRLSDVKELEASIFERQEPTVQGSPAQDSKEKLVDEDTEIAGAGNVEELKISDIQPEVSDVQSGYVKDLAVDHHKSVEEDAVTDVEDNEDSVFHTEELVTFPKFLKVKKSYKSAEEDKASDSESDLEIVEEEDEDADEAEASDATNSQTLMSVLKKKRLKKITKRSYGQKPQKTSTRSEILKFVQISHTG